MQTRPPAPDGIGFECLTTIQRPLLDKFYKHHRSRMRAAGEQAWVARREGIVAALNLTAVAEGHWLTGLFSDPAERRSGIASALLLAALAAQRGPTWLFCEPSLQVFYERLGFTPCATLPAPLAGRLQRYRHTRELLAMIHAGHALPTG